MEIVEKELKQEVSLVEQRANALSVYDDSSYAEASELVKQVKLASKRVEDYWEPMRKSTYDAYKAVNTHKSEMADPLKKAEKIIKAKMSDYVAEVERKRREEEERLRQLAKEEAEKKVREAEEAMLNGDSELAEIAMAEAQVMEQTTDTLSVSVNTPEVSGVSKRKDWEIVSVDSAKVPVEVAGVEIRPVDEKAVMALIRGTKGKVTIPGVVYREKVTLSVRV